jgi:hypothetical protein
MEEVRLIPTAWSRLQHIADVSPICDKDEQVLAEIRTVLERHHALERFGVTLIHRHFELHEGEIIVESTHMEQRRQTVEVRSEAEVMAAGNVIATQWVFDGSRNGMACRVYCEYRDYAHTNRHATTS